MQKYHCLFACLFAVCFTGWREMFCLKNETRLVYFHVPSTDETDSFLLFKVHSRIKGKNEALSAF